MEKIWRIDFNFIDQNTYEYFEVGYNCIDIAEIDRNWCRVVCEPEKIKEDDKSVERHESHEITNINHKYFRKDIII